MESLTKPERTPERNPGYAKNSIFLGLIALTLCSLTPLFVIIFGAGAGLAMLPLYNAVPFFAIPGIISGGLGLKRAEKEQGKANGLAVTGIFLCFLSMAIYGVFWHLTTARHSNEKVYRISCAANLKQIGLALQQYAIDNNGFFPPENNAAGLEYLHKLDYCSNPIIYICPTLENPPQKTGRPLTENTVNYAYRSGLCEKNSPNSPIAWDKPDNHKDYGNILFLDGSVCGASGKNWLRDGISAKGKNAKTLNQSSQKKKQ